MSFTRALLHSRLHLASAGAGAALFGLTSLPLSQKRILRLDGPRVLRQEPSAVIRDDKGKPLIDAHQFATGSVLGIVAGMLVRRLGKLFFLVAIGAAVVLRMLEGSRALPGLDELTGGIARVRRFILNRTRTGDAADEYTRPSDVLSWLKRDISFKGSFVALFLIGLVNT
ncbi:hypothetical protein PYCC9005_003996 [Savitreella phatthalungensis]